MLAPTFQPEAEQLDGLLSRRDETNEGRVPIGIPYLDDCLGGLYPGDLMLWAADTGVGKTALAVSTALAGVRADKNVYLFALEAEMGEVAQRLYFTELGRQAKEPLLDFAGWRRGRWKELDRKYGDAVRKELRPLLARLHVFYKGRGDFTVLNLSQQLEAIAGKAGMVVLDHVHVVDESERETELKAQKRTVGLLRDLALEGRIPICAASHVRKRQSGQERRLLPDTEDIHGSSNLAKIATQVVVVARDWDGPWRGKEWSPTLMRVTKDRGGRQGPEVARVYYDRSTGRYAADYELGRIGWSKDTRKQAWEPIPPDQLPGWADNEVHNLATEDELPI